MTPASAKASTTRAKKAGEQELTVPPIFIKLLGNVRTTPRVSISPLKDLLKNKVLLSVAASWDFARYKTILDPARRRWPLPCCPYRESPVFSYVLSLFLMIRIIFLCFTYIISNAILF